MVLKDCQNNVLYTSQEGKSKEKDYKTAYTQALREAFASFDLIKHEYNGKNNQITDTKKPLSQNEADVSGQKPQEDAKPEVNVGEPLFAKPFGENTFQLLTNNTDIPRLALTISRSSVENVYLASRNTTNGVLLKKNNQWFFEYYRNNELKSELVTIVNFN